MDLSTFLLAALGLATTACAQTAKYCPSSNSDVCYSVNVPDTTASSGNGDIFFQIQGPSTMQWIGLGQGGQMAGSNIFVVYADASGNNVTLSPRLGKGQVQPEFDNEAQVFLLEGSGIANGKMTANVRCSNCMSWQGGTMDVTSSSSSWIWAVRQGSALNQDSPSADISQHNSVSAFTFDLTKARGGSSVNPFLETSVTPSGTVTSSVSVSTPTGVSSGSSEVSSKSTGGPTATAHGAIMALVFVILYPLGAIIIRVLSFRSLVWVHAGMQLVSYLLALAGLGLGVYLGTEKTYKLNMYHPIIGLLVVSLLLIQPFLGYTHHRIYLRDSRRSTWASLHVWFGRALITLGIMNGGLGLRFALGSTSVEIAYGVVAAVVWIAWMGVAVWSDLKRGSGRGRMGDKPLPSPDMGGRGGGGEEAEEMRRF